MRTTPVAKRTVIFVVIWLAMVASAIAAGNLIENESVGESVVRAALWPLPTLTHGLSRAVDAFGDDGRAEPASAYLGRTGTSLLATAAVVIYLLVIAGAANVAARVSLRRRFRDGA